MEKRNSGRKEEEKKKKKKDGGGGSSDTAAYCVPIMNNNMDDNSTSSMEPVAVWTTPTTGGGSYVHEQLQQKKKKMNKRKSSNKQKINREHPLLDIDIPKSSSSSSTLVMRGGGESKVVPRSDQYFEGSKGQGTTTMEKAAPHRKRISPPTLVETPHSAAAKPPTTTRAVRCDDVLLFWHETETDLEAVQCLMDFAEQAPPAILLGDAGACTCGNNREDQDEISVSTRQWEDVVAHHPTYGNCEDANSVSTRQWGGAAHCTTSEGCEEQGASSASMGQWEDEESVVEVASPKRVEEVAPQPGGDTALPTAFDGAADDNPAHLETITQQDEEEERHQSKNRKILRRIPLFLLLIVCSGLVIHVGYTYGRGEPTIGAPLSEPEEASPTPKETIEEISLLTNTKVPTFAPVGTASGQPPHATSLAPSTENPTFVPTVNSLPSGNTENATTEAPAAP